MPPSRFGTSYFPVVTRSAPHLPNQLTSFNPTAVNFSTAADSICESAAPSLPAAFCAWETSNEADGSLGVGAIPDPGCLKIPKSMLFLWGCMLQEIVCSDLTSTQRTRYDFAAVRICGGRNDLTDLAVNLQLLHPSHGDPGRGYCSRLLQVQSKWEPIARINALDVRESLFP